MKRKIIVILFTANTVLLFALLFPTLQGIISIFYTPHAGAIGIIGGADGPTVIYLASAINWYPIIVVLSEIILGVCLYLTRPKK